LAIPVQVRWWRRGDYDVIRSDAPANSGSRGIMREWHVARFILSHRAHPARSRLVPPDRRLCVVLAISQEMDMKAAAILALLVASQAYAHHGWSEYDHDKPLKLVGTIERSGYEHPHGYVHLKTADKTWTVVLAPPTRMENRGLSKQMLQNGNRATVEGYPKRSDPDELRAERITIGDKTTALR